MPHICCIPKCWAGTRPFPFPDSDELRQKWIEKFKEIGLEILKTGFVCDKHFKSSDIAVLMEDIGLQNFDIPLLLPKNAEEFLYCRLCAIKVEEDQTIGFQNISPRNLETISRCLYPDFSKHSEILPEICCFKCHEKITGITLFREKCCNAAKNLLKMIENRKSNQESDNIEVLDTNVITSIDTDSDKSEQSSNIKCSFCNQKFETMYKLKKHKKLCKPVDENSVFPCSKCGKQFKTKSGYALHLKYIHNEERLKQKEERIRKTQENKKKRAEKLKQKYIKEATGKHVAEDDAVNGCGIKNEEDKSNVCDICGRQFQRLSSLKYHMYSHNDVKASPESPKRVHPHSQEHVCHICGKLFKQKGSLNVHMKFHTQERNFECIVCKKKYYTNAELQQHMLKHEGIRFPCPICNKDFALKKTMMRHIKLHDSNSKKFPCTFCPKKFMNEFALKYHVMSHTGVKLHECNFCNDRFRYNYMLTQHKLKRHNIKLEGVEIYKPKKPNRKKTKGADDLPNTSNVLAHDKVVYL